MKPELFELMVQQQDHHWWFRARRRILRDLLKRHLRHPGEAILEAGCGTGGNLAMLAEFGPLTALESDPVARQYALSRSEVKILEGALPNEVPPLDGPPRCIALFDVLEHIEQDGPALARLAQLASDDAQLFLTVPAFPMLWSSHDEQHGHFRRYRRKPLIDLAERNGWQVEYCSYFNSLLFLPAALARIWQNWQGGTTDPGLDIPPQPINRLLEWIFLLDRLLLGYFRLPFGLSLVLIATRQTASNQRQSESS